MKKLIYFYAALIIVFTSCSKSEIDPKNQNLTSSESQNLVLEKIHSFKVKIHSTLKDNEEMNVNDAIWNLEAAINEDYARADDMRDMPNIDSCFINISLTSNGNVLISDLDTIYQQIIDSISYDYYLVTGDKGVVFVDVSLVSTNNTYITIRVIDYIASSKGNYRFPFADNEYWYWGGKQGKCDGSGTGAPDDATTKIAQHANWEIPVHSNKFFTDIETTGNIYPENVPSTGNPFGFLSSYLYFHHDDYFPINDCFNSDILNYYLWGLKIIGGLYKPTGKEIMKYTLYYTFIPGNGYGNLHYAILTYGIPITAPNPPIGF